MICVQFDFAHFTCSEVAIESASPAQVVVPPSYQYVMAQGHCTVHKYENLFTISCSGQEFILKENSGCTGSYRDLLDNKLPWVWLIHNFFSRSSTSYLFLSLQYLHVPHSTVISDVAITLPTTTPVLSDIFIYKVKYIKLSWHHSCKQAEC